jgi:hypothetical protein
MTQDALTERITRELQKSIDATMVPPVPVGRLTMRLRRHRTRRRLVIAFTCLAVALAAALDAPVLSRASSAALAAGETMAERIAKGLFPTDVQQTIVFGGARPVTFVRAPSAAYAAQRVPFRLAQARASLGWVLQSVQVSTESQDPEVVMLYRSRRGTYVALAEHAAGSTHASDSIHIGDLLTDRSLPQLESHGMKIQITPDLPAATSSAEIDGVSVRVEAAGPEAGLIVRDLPSLFAGT